MQTSFKISNYYDADSAPDLDEIIAMIRQKEIAATVILSFGQFLNIVPSRASKDQALRYVAQRFERPLEHILVAGGADEDMMRRNTLAVVTKNHHNEELSQLDHADSSYFSGQSHASGIMEALEHYDFFDTCRVPDA